MLTGRFCHACGEARQDGPLRLGNIVHDSLHATLSLESGFMRTLVGLIRDPGTTIEQYVGGVRRAHCSPVRFFLWMLVIVVAWNGLLDLVLPMDFTDPGLGLYPDWWIDLGRTTPGWQELVTPERLEKSYNDMQRMLKVNGTLQPLAFAVAATLVFHDKGRTFAEHLCFAFYVFGVFLVSTALVTSFTRFGPWWDFWLTLPLPYLHVWFSVSRFYRTGVWMGLVRTFAACLLTLCVVSPAMIGLTVWSMMNP
jgi:hypothetical protein